MKITKKVGKIIILTVLTIVALFFLLPNVTNIEQSIEIPTTPDKIFELINRPANWVEWYTPLQDKAGVQIRYSGPSEGKNAQMKWVSNNPKVPGGEMLIRNARNNRNVSTVVDLDNNHSEVMVFKIRPMGPNVSMLTVTMRMRFSKHSGLNYLRMMFDRSDELKVIDYLELLSDVAVEKAEGLPIALQQVEAFSYIGIIDSCAWQDVSVRMNERHLELLAYAAKSHLTVSNAPIAIYRRMDEHKVVYEAGLPLVELPQTPLTGRIQARTMPERLNAVVEYYGSYDTLEDGHNAVQQWLSKHRRRLAGYPWEMYVTDMATEPDPNQWLTRIFYPVN